jgi:hypothetical protein
MISQIRIYTINKGEMDSFLKHFKEDIISLHQKIGVPITGTIGRKTNLSGCGVTKIRRNSKRRPKSFKRRWPQPESSLVATSLRWKCARLSRCSLKSGLEPLAELAPRGIMD